MTYGTHLRGRFTGEKNLRSRNRPVNFSLNPLKNRAKDDLRSRKCSVNALPRGGRLRSPEGGRGFSP